MYSGWWAQLSLTGRVATGACSFLLASEARNDDRIARRGRLVRLYSQRHLADKLPLEAKNISPARDDRFLMHVIKMDSSE